MGLGGWKRKPKGIAGRTDNDIAISIMGRQGKWNHSKVCLASLSADWLSLLMRSKLQSALVDQKVLKGGGEPVVSLEH